MFSTLLLTLSMLLAVVVGQPLQTQLSSAMPYLNAGSAMPFGGAMLFDGAMPVGGAMPFGGTTNNYGPLCNVQSNVMPWLYGQLNQQLQTQSMFSNIRPGAYEILALGQSQSYPNRYMSTIKLDNGACQGLEFGLNRGFDAPTFCTLHNIQSISCRLSQPSPGCIKPIDLTISPVPVIEQPVVERISPAPVVEVITEAPIVEEIINEPVVDIIQPDVRVAPVAPMPVATGKGSSQNVQWNVGRSASQMTSGVLGGVGDVVHDGSESVQQEDGSSVAGFASGGRGVNQIISRRFAAGNHVVKQVIDGSVGGVSEQVINGNVVSSDGSVEQEHDGGVVGGDDAEEQVNGGNIIRGDGASEQVYGGNAVRGNVALDRVNGGNIIRGDGSLEQVYNGRGVGGYGLVKHVINGRFLSTSVGGLNQVISGRSVVSNGLSKSSTVAPIIEEVPMILETPEDPEVVEAPVVEEVPVAEVVEAPKLVQGSGYSPVCSPRSAQRSTLKGQLNSLLTQQPSFSYIRPNKYSILRLARSMANGNRGMVTIRQKNGVCRGLEVGTSPRFSVNSISRALPIECPLVPAPTCGINY